MILFYVTCKTKDEAQFIARHCLELEIIGSVNIVPNFSVWKEDGEIKEAQEFFLIVKTLAEYAQVVQDEINKVHSADIPCIVQIKTKVNNEYHEWLLNQLGTI